MAVFNLTINTTPDQDTALADLATASNTTQTQVLMDRLNWVITNAVSAQIAIDIQKLQGDPLSTLEILAGQVPKS